MPDSITQELSSAYAQLAELQTKLDEDDFIISALSQNMNTHTDMSADMRTCGDDSARCGNVDADTPRTRCDGYDLAIEIIAARRKELDKELRKVKENIVDIERKWRG